MSGKDHGNSTEIPFTIDTKETTILSSSLERGPWIRPLKVPSFSHLSCQKESILLFPRSYLAPLSNMLSPSFDCFPGSGLVLSFGVCVWGVFVVLDRCPFSIRTRFVPPAKFGFQSKIFWFGSLDTQMVLIYSGLHIMVA